MLMELWVKLKEYQEHKHEAPRDGDESIFMSGQGN
jgi:hypothetical protein